MAARKTTTKAAAPVVEAPAVEEPVAAAVQGNDQPDGWRVDPIIGYATHEDYLPASAPDYGMTVVWGTGTTPDLQHHEVQLPDRIVPDGSWTPPPPPQVAPTIMSMTPSTIAGDDVAQPVNVVFTGTGFKPDQVLVVDGVVIGPIQSTSDGGATYAVPAGTFIPNTTYSVQIGYFPSPLSAAKTFVVTAVTPPPVTPVLTSLSPSQIDPPATDPTQITLTGLNFTAKCVAYFDGEALPTVIISNSTATIAVPASKLPANSAHTVKIGYVTEGIWSNEMVFVVTPPPPTLSMIAPNPIQYDAAQDGETITLTGSQYATGAVALVDGNEKAATFVSATSLTVALAAADLTVGDHAIQVKNPDGKVSNTFTLHVMPQATPTIATLTPTQAVSTDSPFYLVAEGTNYTSDMVMQIDGATIAGSMFVSPTEFRVPGFDPSKYTVGAHLIRVGKPGLWSNEVTFTVTAPVVVTPTIASASPNPIVKNGTAPQNVTVTFTGTNFISGMQVKWNGSALNPQNWTFISATQFSLVVQVNTLADNSKQNVQVVANGVSSNTLQVTINPLPKTITSVAPSTVSNGGITVMRITGTGFVSGDVVGLNNGAKLKSAVFVSATAIDFSYDGSNAVGIGAATIAVGANNTSFRNWSNWYDFTVTA